MYSVYRLPSQDPGRGSRGYPYIFLTSIPSRGSRNTPSGFILQKLEINAGIDELSGSPNYALIGGN